MKIVVTGGAGFLGQRLLRSLCDRGRLTDAAGREREIGQILSIDHAQPARLYVDDRVGYVRGDIGSAGLVEHVMGTDTDSLFHLAAVVSGAAEQDFDLGMRVNLDGTRRLLDACRTQARPPKVVFASSVAVFGGAPATVLDDAAAAQPQSSYGVQKLIGEWLVGEYARRGYLDGRTVRLPTIVVRPGAPNAAASGFASAIIREPLAGVEAVCPVEPDTALWVLSPRAAVAALVRAHEIPCSRWREVTSGRALNLPGLTVTVAQMIEALRAVGGEAAAARVRFAPDERVGAIVRSWPARFATARADALGFECDADFAGIVREFAEAARPW